MKQAASRGARFTFVNPRRIETPDKGIGDTVQIRPDTDVYLLAALLHEIDRLGGLDEGVLASHVATVDGLRAFVARYDAAPVAPLPGIPAGPTRELATKCARACLRKTVALPALTPRV